MVNHKSVMAYRFQDASLDVRDSVAYHFRRQKWAIA
jgi:hypothetical protein